MSNIEYYTVNEIALIVKRTPKTIRRWIAEGFIKKVFKVKDGYLIPKNELQNILKREKY